MKCIVMDLETTGLDPTASQILEFAAVHLDLKTGSVDEFHAYFQPDNGVDYTGEPYALKMNAGIISKIKSGEYVARQAAEVVADFAGRCLDWGYRGQGWVPAGKNVGGFDLQFLKRLPGWKYPHIIHKHRVIDVGCLYLRPTDEVPPDLDECKRRAGVPGRVTHRAMDDVKDCIDCIKVWYEKATAGCRI